MNKQGKTTHYVAVDANATFNPLGEIKPMYVRLEDEEHQLHTYKIQSISNVKEEKYAGSEYCAGSTGPCCFHRR